MEIIDCEQGSDDWFQCRLGKLTASVAHTIAANGKGLDTLCLEKATEILTGIPIEGFKNEAMIHGNEYEAEARNIYELETGYSVRQVGFCKDSEYVGVSPDGLVESPDGAGLVEIKCPTDKTYTQYLIDGVIKPEYYSQMQMQMLVTNRVWCDYVVYNPNFKKSIIIKRVYPDKDEMDKIANGLIVGCEKIKQILTKARDEMEK